MNINTITTKTGLTAIGTIIATGIGIYTGTLPLAAGLQTIAAALIGLFLRDGITTQTEQLRQVAEAAERQAHAEARIGAQADVRQREHVRAHNERQDVGGGA